MVVGSMVLPAVARLATGRVSRLVGSQEVVAELVGQVLLTLAVSRAVVVALHMLLVQRRSIETYSLRLPSAARI